MQRSHCRLVFLHGFLGSPEDWEEVIRHLPGYNCEALLYPFKMPADAIAIGYSMGGRIALRHPGPKILLSTHPGLQTPAEKIERLKNEQRWREKLRTSSMEDFLKAWYDQPLFSSLRSHPDFPKILLRRLQQNPEDLAKMLARESLSHQTFSLPENGTFIHGEFDEKFGKLYRDLQISSLAVRHAGHAIHLENPQGCAAAIKEALNGLNRDLAKNLP